MSIKSAQIKIFFFVLLSSVMLISCTKEDENTTPVVDIGKLSFSFAHHVDGQELNKDSLMYVNAAGNLYEINEVKYFISEVALYKSDGNVIHIDDCKWAHYVDIDISSTLTWNMCDNIPVGAYDSISFTFGISSPKNSSYMFVNPPESNMQWPEMLGGGYHYMMINGKWKDNLQQVRSFNTHLGIGRVISVDDTSFVDNSFRVSLPNSGFIIAKDAKKEIQLIMNIDSWFETPAPYDHNVYGPAIMENQEAMHAIATNGVDVFAVGDN